MKKVIQNLNIAFILLISLSFFACNKSDKIPPILTLLGKDTVSTILNATYTDDGAKATDDLDGDLTKSIVVKNEVNINKVGTYKVLYSVSDRAGNVAPTKTRTVIVYNNSYMYIGTYSVINYIYYPVIDTNTYSTNIVTDSILNNKLIFSVFSDTLTKKSNVYAIVTDKNIEIPFQKVTIASDSEVYTFQGYGTINDTVIDINYSKGIEQIIYMCKANFKKL